MIGMKLQNNEVFRFVSVGIISTITNYGVYWLLLPYFTPSLSFFIGYIAAFIVNYLLTTTFTFRVKASKKNGIGFVITNIINFFLSELFLHVFITLGVTKQLAPIPMYIVCVPVNFLLVRYVMKKL